MFISYAQNMEDVLLWRCFKDLESGTYIDVGANDPSEDSVTKAFYDKGWSGINIEPIPRHHDDLTAQRPRDINLRVAAGDKQGEMEIVDVPAIRGWATMDEAIALAIEYSGHEVVRSKTPVRTLNDICAEHNCNEIHFLKIDVEGFECRVIKGIDLKKIKPWVLLVEAYCVNKGRVDNEDWEPYVLGAGYKLAFFDGLNCFYVSEDHEDLLPSFDRPVNVLDNYARHCHLEVERAHLEAVERVGATELVLSSERERFVKSTEEFQRSAAEAAANLAEARTSVKFLTAEVLSKQNTIEENEAEIRQKTESAKSAQIELQRKDEAIAKAESKLRIKEEAIDKTEAKVRQKDEAIEKAEAKILQKDEAIEKAEAKILQKDEAIEKAEAKILQRDEVIKTVEAEVRQKDEVIKTVEAEVRQKDEVIKTVEARFSSERQNLERSITLLETKTRQMQRELFELKEQSEVDKEAAVALETRVHELNHSSHHWYVHSQKLEQELGATALALQAVKKSGSWRLTWPLRKFYELIRFITLAIVALVTFIIKSPWYLVRALLLSVLWCIRLSPKMAAFLERVIRKTPVVHRYAMLLASSNPAPHRVEKDNLADGEILPPDSAAGFISVQREAGQGVEVTHPDETLNASLTPYGKHIYLTIKENINKTQEDH